MAASGVSVNMSMSAACRRDPGSFEAEPTAAPGSADGVGGAGIGGSDVLVAAESEGEDAAWRLGVVSIICWQYTLSLSLSLSNYRLGWSITIVVNGQI